MLLISSFKAGLSFSFRSVQIMWSAFPRTAIAASIPSDTNFFTYRWKCQTFAVWQVYQTLLISLYFSHSFICPFVVGKNFPINCNFTVKNAMGTLQFPGVLLNFSAIFATTRSFRDSWLDMA